jgi:AcrR family transcriptional regulator
LGRQNKKENVAALHKAAILQAAEQIFLEKGFSAATIDDISKASQYSRRTLYSYFASKEDMLYQIILNGLISLRENLIQAISENTAFLDQYHAICLAMKKYHETSPQSVESVNRAKNREIDLHSLPPAAVSIFAFGTEINNLLAGFIESGKQQGLVRREIQPMQTVYIMWASLTSLLSLVHAKGEFLEREFSATQDDFLQYGFNQIINSILKEPI